MLSVCLCPQAIEEKADSCPEYDQSYLASWVVREGAGKVWSLIIADYRVLIVAIVPSQ